MIIDIILDKKQSSGNYNPFELYSYCMNQLDVLNSMEIARALDCGTEEDVKRELCKYIDLGGYDPKLKDWINKTYWL